VPGTWVVVHVELDYHTEVRKDHEWVEIVVRLARVGASSVRLEHDISLPDGTVAASGATVLVAWDPVARGKRAIAEAERAVLWPGS
jgi:acyl-CoA thioesterase FadM